MQCGACAVTLPLALGPDGIRTLHAWVLATYLEAMLTWFREGTCLKESTFLRSDQSRDTDGEPCPASTLWTPAPPPCPPPRPGRSTPSVPLCFLAGPEHYILGGLEGLWGFLCGIKLLTR